MLDKIISGTIKHRIYVIIAFVFISLLAVYSFATLKVDAIPDIGENQQIIFTDWSGVSPKDIEEQITYPLSNLMQGIPGIKEVRAMSAFGFSVIYVIFKDDIDFYWSRTRILEKLTQAQNILPNGVIPTIGADATGLGQIFWYSIENKKDNPTPKSLAQLRSIQDWYVRFHLQSVDGISEVASIGGFVKEYQIDIDPLQLFARDIHFSKLIAAIKNSNIDVGAEVIEQGEREIIVRGLGFFKSISDIENVVIGVKNNIPIYVKDVANVHLGSAFRRGVLFSGEREIVGGVIAARFGENSKEVIGKIENKLSEISEGLPKGVEIKSFYNRSDIIQKSLSTVYSSIIEEIIIAICVIIFFLLHFRSSILISLTLPLGVGISFILMKIFAIDSNIMSLAGIIVAIGTMVDMGIIMTENIYSNLSQNRKTGLKDRIKSITDSTKEITPAILTAIATTIVTFLPIFFLQNAEGKLFTPLAYAKTFALIGSVLVAIFLIPALSVFFLKGKLRPLEKNKVSLKIIEIYKPILIKILDRPRKFLIIPAIILLFGGIAYKQLGSEFMPQLNEGEILYMPTTVPGISITKIKELVVQSNKIIESHPDVEASIGKIGRADTSLDPAPISMVETIIKLKKDAQSKDIYQIMEELDGMVQIPGFVNSWGFPIQTRIAMISTGIKTQIGIKIFGDDLNKLEHIAAQIGKEVEQVQGAYGIYVEQITSKPYIEFDIDRIKASRYGINTGTINQILQTAIGGMAISKFYDGRERYNIRVRYKKELRDNIEELKRVLVPSPLGMHIPIGQLADIKITNGAAAINSENGFLRSMVLLNVRDRDLVGFVNEAKKIVSEKIDLPKGYSVKWAGEYENQVRSSKYLQILVPLSILINLLILFLNFRSIRDSLIIMSAIPISMAGGMILLWFSGFNLSVAVWVGFIALFGIAVDNGVVMMTYIKAEMKKIKPKSMIELKQVIIDAGSRRIRPLLMTTATTIFALLPIMWSTSIGSEVIKPMAMPVLGGMVFMLVGLFIVPVLFFIFEKRKIDI
ncbi:MAG: Cu(I)/Ag(I) efflux system membrane protein CusA/SilA [Rickettsiales bacterium]|jgi:Cu(I)/Ag(I) efflux system membrane protein CusA/SilA